MQALIYFFFEMCLLRRAPQDLPASELLFRLVLATSLLIGVLVGVIAGQPLLAGVIRSLAQLLLLLAVLFVALDLFGRRPRFLQTATALLGTGALLGLLALIPIGLLPADFAGDQLTLAGLVLLGIFVWSVVVAGHIVRHTFGVTLGQGAAIVVLYELLSFLLLGGLLAGGG
ncbi:hypothetical protein ABC977_10175 [Thioalkalicoccus limnaeus]|uniref:Yip1 domain-containing protein n=1 Tax=Thioalkalicoccus limnaeus TaxID=120681 RepID=A0ABV4BES9_9GAMM